VAPGEEARKVDLVSGADLWPAAGGAGRPAGGVSTDPVRTGRGTDPGHGQGPLAVIWGMHPGS